MGTEPGADGFFFAAIVPEARGSLRRQASPDLPGLHPLAGHLVVFTGKLSALGRKDACALVVRLGGLTADDVTSKTTMLVVGLFAVAYVKLIYKRIA